MTAAPFDPAELRRLARDIDRPREWGTNDRAKHEFAAYCGTHRDAIVALTEQAAADRAALKAVQTAIAGVAVSVARCGSYMEGPEPVGVYLDEAVDILAAAVIAVDETLDAHGKAPS